MKLLPLILLLMLSGCCIPRLDWDEIPADKPVFIELLDQEAPSSDGIFRVRVRFYERTEYEGLLQEIRFSDGTSLVEYFRLDDGRMGMCHKDIHTRKGVTHEVREMKVYPANVEGVDYDSNFAHLPENMDGSLHTLIGPKFNEDYQKNHATRGRVIAAAPELAVHWKIELADSKLKVTINN